jgi:uncharacterized membrane protein
MNAQGFVTLFRFVVGLVLILIGLVLLQQSVWLDRNVEQIMRTPYVLAAVGVGIFCVVAGVRMVRSPQRR